MKYTIAISLVVVLSLSIFLVSANSGTMKKIARNIYNMQDACADLNVYELQHTEADNRIYIQNLVAEIEKHMERLQENYMSLDSTDVIQVPLRTYLDKWSTEKIQQSLVLSNSEFLSDTNYISSFLPPRKKWRTLFPIFRP